MAGLSVSQAAERLGVSRARVHQRIDDGSLPASRIGGQWVVDEAALLDVPGSSGRPLSYRAAWALLALGAPGGPAAVAPLAAAAPLAASEWARARDRLAALRRDERPDDLLRRWLRRRADRRVLSAARGDLDDVRADPRLLPSGLSAPHSGIAAADLAEGYLAREHLDAFVDRYLLLDRPDGAGNVVLHVVPRRPHEVWPLLVAADLSEHRDSRARWAARALVAAP